MIRKKYLFYALAIISSFIAATTASIDGAISFLFIKNPWIFGLSIFLVGIIVTFFISLFLSIPVNGKSIGSRIDPSFKRIRFIKREELSYHLLAGVGNTATTIGYFYVLSIFIDPSAVLPFFQIVILYLLITESVAEKNAPTLAEIQSSVIVTFGAIMGSISLTGEINLWALLVVFLVVNPGWTILSIYQRKLKLMKIDGRANDSINIRFWNLVFTTMFIFIAVFFVNKNYFFDSLHMANKYFPWLALSMIITFFSYILYIRALGIGKASVTQAVKASTIIFVIPFSFVLYYFIPISFSVSPVLLLIKIMGIILVLLGVISFALTEIKAYVFINVKRGYPVKEIINKIWDIKGVTAVSATAGAHDLLAKIRMRTLGKGYERIIRRLEGIEGIEEFKWQSILKEWEKI